MQGTFAWITGGVVAIIGLLGLFLSSRAVDLGFAGFGMALFFFAILYIFLAIKQSFDRAESGGQQA
jgi:hypothetical protein